MNSTTLLHRARYAMLSFYLSKRSLGPKLSIYQALFVPLFVPRLLRAFNAFSRAMFAFENEQQMNSAAFQEMMCISGRRSWMGKLRVEPPTDESIKICLCHYLSWWSQSREFEDFFCVDLHGFRVEGNFLEIHVHSTPGHWNRTPCDDIWDFCCPEKHRNEWN